MTILTKPSAGAKQIPKTANAESVENGAVIEQVHFFNTFFFSLFFHIMIKSNALASWLPIIDIGPVFFAAHFVCCFIPKLYFCKKKKNR